MLKFAHIPEAAQQQIICMEDSELVEFFAYCIDNDELAVAEFINEVLFDTLTPGDQQRIVDIMLAGQARAIEQCLAGATMH